MYWLAAVMFASTAAHGLVWLFDGGAWEGPVSWRKPIVFGISFATTFLAIGWLQGVLPHSRPLGRWTTILVGGGGVVETVLISGQRWRGVASHFNTSTPLDAAIFSVMGVTIAMLLVGLVTLTVWSAMRLRGSTPVLIAALVGLGLMLVGSAIGQGLINRGFAVVEETGDVPFAVTIGLAGSGKLAHAVALHGLQVLAVLALLLARSGLAPPARTRVMAIGAVGYAGLTGLVTGQAYAGLSMLELSWPVAAGLVLSLLLVAGSLTAALFVPSRAT